MLIYIGICRASSAGGPVCLDGWELVRRQADLASSSRPQAKGPLMGGRVTAVSHCKIPTPKGQTRLLGRGAREPCQGGAPPLWTHALREGGTIGAQAPAPGRLICPCMRTTLTTSAWIEHEPTCIHRRDEGGGAHALRTRPRSIRPVKVELHAGQQRKHGVRRRRRAAGRVGARGPFRIFPTSAVR